MKKIDIEKEAMAIEQEVIELRRHFHMYPEPSLKEFETSRYICETLEKMGIAYRRAGETGVIAEIAPGKDTLIALRADMDALMIHEKTSVDYKSRNEGCMHACGHDAHTAALLGAAKIIKKYEDCLEHSVRLIFEPAEENCCGANIMLENHVLDGVSEIYGIHVFTDIPAGDISIEAGPRMAATDMFKVHITGKAGHAAKPHQCVDATVAAAASIMNLQTIVSREIDPVEGAVVTVGKLSSGTQYNIISGYAEFEGTVRTFAKETSEHIQESIERIVDSTVKAYRGEAAFDFKPSRHPVVINDEKLSEKAHEKAAQLFGRERLVHIAPLMLGEDFSIYQTMVPGVFAFVGGGNPEIGCGYPNHHDCFNIDESVLKDCVMLYTMFALK